MTGDETRDGEATDSTIAGRQVAPMDAAPELLGGPDDRVTTD